MVRIGLFEESLHAKDGMVKVVELWPRDIDVQSGKMVLDGPTDAFGKPIDLLEAVHLKGMPRQYLAKLIRSADLTPDAKKLEQSASRCVI